MAGVAQTLQGSKKLDHRLPKSERRSHAYVWAQGMLHEFGDPGYKFESFLLHFFTDLGIICFFVCASVVGFQATGGLVVFLVGGPCDIGHPNQDLEKNA